MTLTPSSSSTSTPRTSSAAATTHRIAVNFDLDGKGFIDARRDGEQIVDYDGPIGYGYGVYWKHGIYRESRTDSSPYKDSRRLGWRRTIAAQRGRHDRPDTSPDGQPSSPTTATSSAARRLRLARAEGGDDILVSGAGNDRILAAWATCPHGGKGNDRLVGDAGNECSRAPRSGHLCLRARLRSGHDQDSRRRPRPDRIDGGIFDGWRR
jgi:hypothetical protein